MRQTIAIFGGALGLASALGAVAHAQEQGEYLTQHVSAPSNALELKVGTGYTQGFGMTAPGRSLPNVAGPGLGVSADVDYRLTPRWSFGGEAQYQEFTNQQNSSARGLAANIGATVHFNPDVRGDPWLRLGAGYRLLWENDPTGVSGITVLRHGFDLVAAKIGYDVRVSENVALAPVVGADLNVFLWEDASNSGSHALSSAQAGAFVYAGLQGRFDIGGTRTGAETARRVTQRPSGVTAPQPQSPIAPPAPVEKTKPASPSIAVSEDVLRICKLDLDAIDKAPKFDFDRSALLPADFEVLNQVAECFTTGPMKGSNLQLVGRADPRGTVSYNDALGMRRAREVAAYLEQRGVEPTRIEQRSRGKRDAVGRDEASWAIDRRVDILDIP
jgi:outer membrane protein OmpA-like peptidoglycan-associated protein